MGRAGGLIYAIGAEGIPLVKIGSTQGTVARRLKTLQTGQPFALHILAAMAVEGNARQIESSVHQFLELAHRRGEWFEIAIANQAEFEALVVKAVQWVAEQEVQRETLREAESTQPHTLDTLPIFAKRLTEARRLRNITQEALADQAGLYKSDISKYERGESLPTLHRLLRLVDALNISCDYLLGYGEGAR